MTNPTVLLDASEYRQEIIYKRIGIGLKNADRPFPANQEVGVLKWRYTSTDASEIPLTSEKQNSRNAIPRASARSS